MEGLCHAAADETQDGLVSSPRHRLEHDGCRRQADRDHGGFRCSLPGAFCLGVPTLTTNSPYDIAWNNGQASNINLSYTDVVAEGMEQVTGAGTVTSGEFTGAAVTIIWLDTVPDPLQCLTPGGVTGQTGPMTAEITL